MSGSTLNPGPALAGPKQRTCLDVEALTINYGTGPDAVSQVSLTVAEGEIVGVIGESGCGKSSLGLALLGLLPPTAEVTAERLDVAGNDLLGMGDRDVAALRGDVVSMVFQEPMSALNPVMRIGEQIQEVLFLHGTKDRKVLAARAVELLALVQVPEPELRARQYPHQMSGGMRQRVVIAIAMAANPRLLVADEPTTALDVTVQAQILSLLTDLRDRTGMGMLLISHDLGVIANVCDRVIVMYAGQIIEAGTPEQVLRSATHPYTRGLLGSIPRLDLATGEDLPTIPGGIAAEDRARIGCRFLPRCHFATDACALPQELQFTGGGDHVVRCILADTKREDSPVCLP